MPPRQKKTAQSSTAQAMLAAKGGPSDKLSSFLGGFVAGTGDAVPSGPSTAQQENESAIAVNLKLLTKSSDITKQKSLNELITLVGEAPEGSLAQFVPTIAEAVIRHTHYLHPLVRASVYALLRALMGRDKDVKVSLVPNLPALAPEWVLAMHDMEAPVRHEAKEAFEATFTAEKRPAMLLMYKDDILRTIFASVSDIALSGKQLQDDQLDARANTLFSALRAMGFMIKHVVQTQTAVLNFILENAAFMKALPSWPPVKGYIAERTPLVRSASLSLLRDVTAVCPVTTRVHQLIAQAVSGSIMDTNPTVAERVWELLLFWCRVSVPDLITSMQSGFLDAVVDCFMECDKPELAEVIFPCLFPFLTQLSKDLRLPDMLDEFCGALVEKLRLLGDTPNISAQELQIIFKSLMECWELHCVRKKGTGAASDSEELFTVILTNLSLLLQSGTKRRRYERVVVDILSTSLIKTAGRNELAFKHCIAILCDLPDALFRPVPEDADTALVDSYKHLRATTVGALLATAVATGANARQLPMYEGFVAAMITQCMADGDTSSLVAVINGAGATYVPSPDTKRTIVDYLVQIISALEGAADNAAATSCKLLLGVALSWDDKECVGRLADITRGDAMEGVQQAVKDHLLKDPTKAFDLLILSCETNAFEDVKRVAQQIAEAGKGIDGGQEARLLAAVVGGLSSTLALAKGDTATMNLEKRAAALDSDDDEDDSSYTDTEGSDSGSDNDDNDSSGSDNGSSKSEAGGSSDAAAAATEDTQNEGTEVLLRAAEWAELLMCGRPLANLMKLEAGVFKADIAPFFYQLTAAVAPPLLPEYYVSIKGLRAALLSQAGDSSDDDDDSAAGPGFDFQDALETKTHSLKADNFYLMIGKTEQLLDSHGMAADERDKFASIFMDDVLSGDVPLCFEAFHQLQQVVPFASASFLQRFVEAAWFADRFYVRRKPAVSKAAAEEQLSLFDGYLSLADLDVTLFSVVRTAQLLRLMDSSDVLSSSAAAPSQHTAQAIFFLLKAALVKEAFSESARSVLFDRLLSRAFARINSKPAAAKLAALIVDGGNQSAHLLVTLAAVLRDIARAATADEKGDEYSNFLLNGRRIMSAVTEAAADALFTPTGAKGIPKELATVYASFYSLMDETANAVRDNMLAQLPAEKEALVKEACTMLPSWDLTTAKLALVVHRHLGSMPAVSESTVKTLIAYAQKQSPLECLELLAELSMARILVLTAFSEVVRVIVHSLCRCYTLCHLPTNGRLSQQAPDRPSPPLPFTQLRRIVIAAVIARRGVVIHSRADDVLRSTVNLVVFDIVCEAVSRLRAAKEEEVPLVAKLIAFTTDFMSELLTSDVAVLRASEASVAKIASVLCFAYLWVSVTPIAKLESIGMETVAALIRCVCQLSNLTIMRSGFPLQQPLRVILNKISLKPIRDEFSSSSPIKVAVVRRQNMLVSKTHKQKLLLYPYLLAWAISLTCARPADDAGAASTGRRFFKVRRSELCSLLDLILALLFTPYVNRKKGGRVEDTFIGSAIGGNDGNPFAGMLGFEVVALTRTDAADAMAQLARGAASVFTLLLSGPTLSFVKDWIETLERKMQALLFDFVQVYVSPTLIQENLLAVLSHSPDGATTFNISEEMSVHVSLSQRVIDLLYEMEDAKVSVSISFPPAYPLRKPTVDFGSGRDCGISTEKWRSWMLKMTAMLFGGSSDIWDCVELFRRNLHAHLGGQEPCPICFAVVSAVNHKLPDMRCSVCHNSAFHSNCLYTWWANGGQHICPLCRSPWISD